MSLLKRNKNYIFSDYSITLDLELKNHMKRVSEYSEILAHLMKISVFKIDFIKTGALLHDIGKSLINKEILNKPSALSLQEFEIIKKHSELGFKSLLSKHQNSIIKNIVLFHHEKWNGTGYPLGLKESNIPIESRIVSIADFYDALTSDRTYKKAYSHEKVIEIIKSEREKSFDPDIVDIFEMFQYIFKKKLKNYNY